jgi:hypothetical protein
MDAGDMDMRDMRDKTVIEIVGSVIHFLWHVFLLVVGVAMWAVALYYAAGCTCETIRHAVHGK